ncbi:MAG: hypothetical protein KDB03_05140 [Planctomycetales bacterium]|nr:hypothetical protein [Planctomycetales bacterium]
MILLSLTLVDIPIDVWKKYPDNRPFNVLKQDLDGSMRRIRKNVNTWMEATRYRKIADHMESSALELALSGGTELKSGDFSQTVRILTLRDLGHVRQEEREGAICIRLLETHKAIRKRHSFISPLYRGRFVDSVSATWKESCVRSKDLDAAVERLSKFLLEQNGKSFLIYIVSEA